MSLEQVRNTLSSWYGCSEACLDVRMCAEVLGPMISAIDAHLVSQPAEQPMGERFALGYVPGELDRTAPEVIYLQVDTAGDNDDRSEPWTGHMDENVSWCAEPIGGLEIQYVRADLIAQPKPEQAKPEQATGDGVTVESILSIVDGVISDHAGDDLDDEDVRHSFDSCLRERLAEVLASPSAPRVGVPIEVIHRYLDAEGPLMYKPSFSTKPPSHAQQAEFARARDDLRKAMIAAAPEVKS